MVAERQSASAWSDVHGLENRGSCSKASSVSERRNAIRSARCSALSGKPRTDRALVRIVVADAPMSAPSAIGAPAGGVVRDHVFERRRAAVVHVRRGDRDVAQRRRLELADVFGLLGDFVDAGIGRRIRQGAGEVVETGVVKLDVLLPGGLRSPPRRRCVKPPWQRKHDSGWLKNSVSPRRAAAGDRGVVALVVIAVVGRSRRDDRALERGQRLRDVLERERIGVGAKGPLEQRPIPRLAAQPGQQRGRPASPAPARSGARRTSAPAPDPRAGSATDCPTSATAA